MDNVTALSEYIIGTRDTLRQVAFLYRYRRRLAKGFQCLLHLRVVNVGIDHGGGQVRMAEHFLNQADLACLPIEIRCERVQKGKRGKILVSDAVLAVLRRMRELEDAGLSPRIARSEVIREMGNGDGDREPSFAEGHGTIQSLRRENDQLREEIMHLREEVAWLRARVDQLTPLALPRPRRWLSWLWPARGRGGSSLGEEEDRRRRLAAL